MKKEKILISIILFLVIVVISIQLYSYKKINNTLIYKNVFNQSENVQKSYVNYMPIQCKFKLLNPEYAFVNYLHYIYPDRNIDKESQTIGFYTLTRSHIFSSNWNLEYTGGTTLENTTFPELVKMVKEDCSQFQEDYDNPKVDEGGIDWGYREVDPPEPPKTEEDLKYERGKDVLNETRSARFMFNETFTDYQQEKWSEMFGDPNSMTPEEIYEMKQGVYASGGIEAVFGEYLFDEEGNLIAR